MPKALLPIANQPMISYSLSWLEASGVSGKIEKGAMDLGA